MVTNRLFLEAGNSFIWAYSWDLNLSCVVQKATIGTVLPITSWFLNWRVAMESLGLGLFSLTFFGISFIIPSQLPTWMPSSVQVVCYSFRSLDLYFFFFCSRKGTLIFWHPHTTYEEVVVYQIGTFLWCANSLVGRVCASLCSFLFIPFNQVWEIMFFYQGIIMCGKWWNSCSRISTVKVRN